MRDGALEQIVRVGRVEENEVEFLTQGIEIGHRVAADDLRAVLQPRLDVRTGQCGTVAPKSAAYQPAGTQALRELQRSLRRQARTLLRRAAEHLETHAAEFPEYDPHKNILNRCTTDGNFVQTR